MRGHLAELEAKDVQLTESEQQRKLYHYLVEHSLGLMCSHDLNGVLLLVNPAAAESLGYSAGEGVGHNLRDFLAPEVQPEFDAYLDRIRRNSSDSGYMRLRAKNGSERVWLYRNVKYEEQGMRPVVLGHALDATYQIRGDQALKESKERFRKLFEDAPIAYHEMDPSGVLRRVNRAEGALLGWSAREMMGRHITDFVVPEEREHCRLGMLQRATQAHSGPGPCESRFVQRLVRKDGTVRSLEVQENAIFDGSAQLAGSRWALLDISDRLASEQQICKLNADLEQRVAQRTDELLRSNSDLQQFAYIVSHDLKAPLQQVGSIVKLLADRHQSALEQDAADCIDNALDGVKRMSLLIDDLLQYSMASNAAAPPAQEVELASVVEGSLVNLRMNLEESQGSVTHDSLPTVLADPIGMLQVFQNLIGNALKYRRSDPPRINISAEAGADAWLVSVKDNGIGIAAPDQERIFGAFKRLHGKEYPGTGIGLSICQKIVERNGGRIWVESEPGKGSTFLFTLPR